MKYLKLVLFILIFASPIVGWTQTAAVEKADVMPRFAGCEDAELSAREKNDCSNLKVIQYIKDNIKYPEKALEERLEGTVVVDFVVDEKGKISDTEIIREVGGGCGNEAIRVLESMPTWTPGKLNGKPVKVKLRVPVRFNIPDNNSGKYNSSYYRIYWGDLRMQEIPEKEFIKIAYSTPVIVRDLYGKGFSIDELTLTYERGSKVKVMKNKGKLNAKMLKMVSKVKAGGDIIVECLIQKDARFITVTREYKIIE